MAVSHAATIGLGMTHFASKALSHAGQGDCSIFDAVVIGAGPAGSTAAALLAARGWRVLMAEKSSWPRDKVCGGCVNAHAMATLERLGLGAALRGAGTISSARLARESAALNVATAGRAITRRELDRNLVDQAVVRGAMFRPECAATLLPDTGLDSPTRLIELRHAQSSEYVQARVILAADGINGTSLRNEPASAWQIDRRAWFGVAGSVKIRRGLLADETIDMNIGDGGYVGLVRQRGGAIHLGAALDPQLCRTAGGPAELIKQILSSNGWDLSLDGPLHGTGLLTRRRRTLGGHRMLCIGDACGYVEPFTGEGIAWALASAEAAISLMPSDPREWPVDMAGRWKRLHPQIVGRQQRLCRAARFLVRRPLLWNLAVAAGRSVPSVLSRLVPSPTVSMAGDVNE